MNFRFWKYFNGVGVSGTIGRIPALIVLFFYWSLALLGFLGVAAFVYAIWPDGMWPR